MMNNGYMGGYAGGWAQQQPPTQQDARGGGGGGPNSYQYDPQRGQQQQQQPNWGGANATHDLFLSSLMNNYNTTQHHQNVAVAMNAPQHHHQHQRQYSLDEFELVRDLFEDTPNVVHNSMESIPLPDPWLDEFSIRVSGIALEPLSGRQVVERIQQRCNDVSYRYIPCADFLVTCQQELRKGLQLVQRQQRSNRNNGQQQQALTFFEAFVKPLPQKFYYRNQFKMDQQPLNSAFQELNKLLQDARRGTTMTAEAVKSNFLGGMREGESWGLRKWLSKNGNGLQLCTDLECIMKEINALDKKAETTEKFGNVIRSITEETLRKLRNDIPASYQERSAAHPYLPFFHRIEEVLRRMSTFDPKDDGVICLDDSDDDESVNVTTAPPAPASRASSEASSTSNRKRLASREVNPTTKRFSQVLQITNSPPYDHQSFRGSSSSGESVEGETVNVINNTSYKTEDRGYHGDSIAVNTAGKGSNLSWPSAQVVSPINWHADPSTGERAKVMAGNIDALASFFDQGFQTSIRPFCAPYETFWDGPAYASALRILTKILRSPEVAIFVERVDDEWLDRQGYARFSQCVAHPIALFDIVKALIDNVTDGQNMLPACNTGELEVRSLASWNMWRGQDLLMAIDLVFLNLLGYTKLVGQDKSDARKLANKLRRELWNGINEIVNPLVGDDSEKRRQVMPKKRSDTSGFVIYKIQS